MLNILHPPAQHPLSRVAGHHHSQQPARTRAGSHPPVADGSHRRDAPLEAQRPEPEGRMGYEPVTWAGQMPIAIPQGGVMEAHALPASARVSLLPPAADAAAFTLTANPPSAAPPARYQPSSPVHAPEFEALGNEENTDESSNQIVSYLQIPSSINDSKGSLSDFAAQITCLFWFESSFTLHRVEEAPTTPIPSAPLVEEAKPCMAFRKWVTTMLSTTQVTQNVILLALLFIYRLKKQNPKVKGKPGSEYRLLTVALMLGNKFLDDNTYTNKTWADVSGIAVAEIHVMEVEFLSNMRYNLYASDKEWGVWHKKLGRFWDYFDRASKPLNELRLLPSVPLPSPPQSQRSSPSFRTYDANPAAAAGLPPYIGPGLPGPLPSLSSRKRSYDEGMEEPPAKRVSRSTMAVSRPTRPRGLSDGPQPSFAPEQMGVRLPMPAYTAAPYTSTSMYTSAAVTQPTATSNRAMALVYGNQPAMANPQALVQPLSTPNSYLNASNLARLQIPPLSAPAPVRVVQPMPARSATGSPTNLPPTANQELLSPASYAMNRSSPYRPVRTVNTLLVPPPSTSFHNPPLHLGPTNMHYQPLGRPLSERRTGIVPYVHHDLAQWGHSSPFR